MPEIIGYRNLTGGEIADMNEIKKLGEQLGNLVSYLKQPGNGYDQRWIAIGVTQLQQGLMALARAVAQPTSF